jgi:hypothetical protein
MTDLTSQVQRIIDERDSLRDAYATLESAHHLVRDQYDMLSSRVGAMQRKYEADLLQIQIERDEAVRYSQGVQAVINSMVNVGASGMRKIRGDQTPEVISEPATHDLLPKVTMG